MAISMLALPIRCGRCRVRTKSSQFDAHLGLHRVPRLVMVSHGNLRANTEAIVRSQGLGSDEKAMLIMPVSYCFGASVMHSHLYQGWSCIRLEVHVPDKVLRAINTYGCTTFAGVPPVYNPSPALELQVHPVARTAALSSSGGGACP